MLLELSHCWWPSEWNAAQWLVSIGRGLGDPHTTTDSWASPDCSVSEAGPAAAPGHLPAGVINTSTTKVVTEPKQQFKFCLDDKM